MAKATHSQEILTGTADSFTEHELNDPSPPVVVRRAMLGGDPKSVGTDSSESLNRETQSDKSENQDLPSPAQTTENRSGQTEQESDSSARSTGGGGRKTTPQRSGKRAPVTRRASSRAVDEDDDFD